MSFSHSRLQPPRAGSGVACRPPDRRPDRRSISALGGEPAPFDRGSQPRLLGYRSRVPAAFAGQRGIRRSERGLDRNRCRQERCLVGASRAISRVRDPKQRRPDRYSRLGNRLLRSWGLLELDNRRADYARTDPPHPGTQFGTRGTARKLRLRQGYCGCQRIRTERALVAILEKFIAKELQPWTRIFPYEFYGQMVQGRTWLSSPPVQLPLFPLLVGVRAGVLM